MPSLFVRCLLFVVVMVVAIALMWLAASVSGSLLGRLIGLRCPRCRGRARWRRMNFVPGVPGSGASTVHTLYCPRCRALMGATRWGSEWIGWP